MIWCPQGANTPSGVFLKHQTHLPLPRLTASNRLIWLFIIRCCSFHAASLCAAACIVACASPSALFNSTVSASMATAFAQQSESLSTPSQSTVNCHGVETDSCASSRYISRERFRSARSHSFFFCASASISFLAFCLNLLAYLFYLFLQVLVSATCSASTSTSASSSSSAASSPSSSDPASTVGVDHTSGPSCIGSGWQL